MNFLVVCTLNNMLVEVGRSWSKWYYGLVTIGRFGWSFWVLRFSHMESHWIANLGHTDSLD